MAMQLIQILGLVYMIQNHGTIVLRGFLEVVEVKKTFFLQASRSVAVAQVARSRVVSRHYVQEIMFRSSFLLRSQMLSTEQYT